MVTRNNIRCRMVRADKDSNHCIGPRSKDNRRCTLTVQDLDIGVFVLPMYVEAAPVGSAETNVK